MIEEAIGCDVIRTTRQVPTSDMSRGRSKRAQCASCFKKFLAFLFSTLGLCCFMVSYTILGGYIFKQLETENELKQRHSISLLLNHSVNELFVIAKKHNIIREENWTMAAQKVLRNYTRHVYAAVDEGGWDGKEEGDDYDPQWSFPGSMLYSITVITTIGEAFSCNFKMTKARYPSYLYYVTLLHRYIFPLKRILILLLSEFNQNENRSDVWALGSKD